MRAGLKVVGQSGTVQLDSSFSTPSLVRTGLITVEKAPTRDATFNGPYVEHPATGMLFIGNTSGAYVGILGRVNPDTGKVRYTFYGTEAVTVRYYIFDYTPTLDVASTYGLQIFKEDGSLYFDARSSLLLMEKIVDIPYAGNASTAAVMPAALLTVYGIGAAQTSPNNASVTTRAMLVTDTSVSTTVLLLTNPALPLFTVTQLNASQILVVKRPNV